MRIAFSRFLRTGGRRGCSPAPCRPCEQGRVAAPWPLHGCVPRGVLGRPWQRYRLAYPSLAAHFLPLCLPNVPSFARVPSRFVAALFPAEFRHEKGPKGFWDYFSRQGMLALVASTSFDCDHCSLCCPDILLAEVGNGTNVAYAWIGMQEKGSIYTI